MSTRTSVFTLSALIVFGTSTAWSSNCANVSTGMIPITELTGLYQGYAGGLYPNGSNAAPQFHDSAGQALATQYLALNTFGFPQTDGYWVLLSVGMSNCTQEFSTFVTSLVGDTTLHPRLRIVDGAQGGQTAAKIKYDTANFWNVAASRLTAQGLSTAQVQAIWLKEANASPSQPFPLHAQGLRDDLRDVVRVAKSKYPNLRQIFVSSRTYAGYASTALNPEPYAYESGFSYRWLIEAQIDGSDSLNYLSDSGTVNSAWIGWGPYLWADGTTPRMGDALNWLCDDFISSDGTHPSPSGRQKVANLLETFFKSSPFTTPWFLKPSAPSFWEGDADGDGLITISDAVLIVAYIFAGGEAPTPIELGDADCSGAIDIADATYLIAYIFLSGPAPECGL